MLFMVLARMVYALPFIAYALINRNTFLANQQAFSCAAVWLALLIISLFFFSLGKFVAWPMTHFVFVSECILFTRIYTATGDGTWLLFVWLSSFFAAEALRNDTLHVFVHILLLSVYLIFIWKAYDITVWQYITEPDIAIVVAAPLFCRCLMSIMESKNVVLRHIIKQKDVYIPMSNDSELETVKQRYQKEIESLKGSCARAEENIEKLQHENLKLDEALKEGNLRNAMSLDIANRYFQMSVAPMFDINHSIDENIDNVLHLSTKILDAKYMAFFRTDGEEINLTNSFGNNFPTNFPEQEFVEGISSKVLDTITNKTLQTVSEGLEQYGLSWAGFIPCGPEGDIRGVLVAGFEKADEIRNIHYANLLLASAGRIYNIVTNERAFVERETTTD